MSRRRTGTQLRRAQRTCSHFRRTISPRTDHTRKPLWWICKATRDHNRTLAATAVFKICSALSFACVPLTIVQVAPTGTGTPNLSKDHTHGSSNTLQMCAHKHVTMLFGCEGAILRQSKIDQNRASAGAFGRDLQAHIGTRYWSEKQITAPVIAAYERQHAPKHFALSPKVSKKTVSRQCQRT